MSEGDRIADALHDLAAATREWIAYNRERDSLWLGFRAEDIERSERHHQENRRIVLPELTRSEDKP